MKKNRFWRSSGWDTSLITANEVFFIVNQLSNRTYNLITNTIQETETYLVIPLETVKSINDTNLNLNKTFYTDYSLQPTNFNQKNNNIWRKKVQWTFLKFKYHGKGYKIKKYNNLQKLTLRFGKSHWTKILYNKKNICIRRTKKNTYCILATSNKYLSNWKKLFIKAKGVSKYTKRGVRLCRAAITKRFGKISQASSVYK